MPIENLGRDQRRLLFFLERRAMSGGDALTQYKEAMDAIGLEDADRLLGVLRRLPDRCIIETGGDTGGVREDTLFKFSPEAVSHVIREIRASWRRLDLEEWKRDAIAMLNRYAQGKKGVCITTLGKRLPHGASVGSLGDLAERLDREGVCSCKGGGSVGARTVYPHDAISWLNEEVNGIRESQGRPTKFERTIRRLEDSRLGPVVARLKFLGPIVAYVALVLALVNLCRSCAT